MENDEKLSYLYFIAYERWRLINNNFLSYFILRFNKSESVNVRFIYQKLLYVVQNNMHTVQRTMQAFPVLS